MLKSSHKSNGFRSGTNQTDLGLQAGSLKKKLSQREEISPEEEFLDIDTFLEGLLEKKKDEIGYEREERSKAYSRFPLDDSVALYEALAESQIKVPIASLKAGLTDKDSQLYLLIQEDWKNVQRRDPIQYINVVLGALASSVAKALNTRYLNMVKEIESLTSKNIEDCFQEAMIDISKAYRTGAYNPVSSTFYSMEGVRRSAANFRNYALSIVEHKLKMELNAAKAWASPKGSSTYHLWDCPSCKATNVTQETVGPFICSYCSKESASVKLEKPQSVVKNLETSITGGEDDEELLLLDILGDPTSAEAIHSYEMTELLEKIRDEVRVLPIIKKYPILRDVFDYLYDYVDNKGEIPSDEQILAHFVGQTQPTVQDISDTYDFTKDTFEVPKEPVEEILPPEVKPKETFLSGSFKICYNSSDHANEEPRILPLSAEVCDECLNHELEIVEGIDASEVAEGGPLLEGISEPTPTEVKRVEELIPGRYKVCFYGELHDPEVPIIFSEDEKKCKQCDNEQMETLDDKEGDIRTLIYEGSIIEDISLRSIVRKQAIEEPIVKGPAVVEKPTKVPTPQAKEKPEVQPGRKRLVYVCTNTSGHLSGKERILIDPYCIECRTADYVERRTAAVITINPAILQQFRDAMKDNPKIKEYWEDAKERVESPSLLNY